MATNNCWNSQNPAQVARGGTGRASIPVHNLIIGADTNAVSIVSADAQVGKPLISQGIGSDPAYGTAVVSGGGTGNTSFSAYNVLLGGTTVTGPLQTVATPPDTTCVLASQGPGNPPVWQPVSTPAGSLPYSFNAHIAESLYTINLSNFLVGSDPNFTVENNPDGVFAANGVYTAAVNGLYQFNCFFEVWANTGYGRLDFADNSYSTVYRMLSTLPIFIHTGPNYYAGIQPFLGSTNWQLAFCANPTIYLSIGQTVSMWYNPYYNIPPEPSVIFYYTKAYFSGYLLYEV